MQLYVFVFVLYLTVSVYVLLVCTEEGEEHVLLALEYQCSLSGIRLSVVAVECECCGSCCRSSSSAYKNCLDCC